MAKILLVDDNGSVLLTLAIALRRRGHEVSVATDGITALQELKTNEFDFLVSDVRMPGMSGVELANAAHDLPHTPRIILTSAYSSIEGREGLAEAFLRKPIDTEQLDSLLQDGSGGDPDIPQVANMTGNGNANMRELRPAFG